MVNEPPKNPPPRISGGLAKYLGDLSSLPRLELPKETQDHLDQVAADLRAYREQMSPVPRGMPKVQAAPVGVAEESDEALALKPAIVGDEAPADEGKPKRGRRAREGKSLLHGADRTVRVYKVTEAELERLGELSRDETTARAWMAFCLGLLVNVALGLLFASGLSAANKAAGMAIGVIALLGAVKFGWDAHKKHDDGKAALNRIKEDCDFANT